MQGVEGGSGRPDLLVLGGLWTGDPERPLASALLVRDGRVAAVGDRDEMEAAARGGFETLDHRNASILPGFVEAHAHLVDGGLHLARLDLTPADGRRAWDALLSAFAGGVDGEWILGGGWDHERWGGELPARDWLDPHTGARPALLTRSDLHLAVANSAALARAGIDDSTPDPEGGQILRDGEGRPTGVLTDNAIRLVEDLVPEPSDTELDAALARACAHALRFGITQLHDKGTLPPSWRDLEVLERAEARGEVPLRVQVATPVEEWSALAERVARRGNGSAMVRWGTVKGFVDGSLGAGTAWFTDPYDDLPGEVGLAVTDLDALGTDIHAAWDAGIQPVIHAIGDAAVDWLVDVYEALGPGREGTPPPRIEHVQHLRPGTAARIGRTRAVASMQPVHLVDDAPWLTRRLGEDRASRSYAIRSLVRSGVPIAFGSDWTVAPLDPRPGIRAAVDRRGRDGTRIAPAEAITLEEALRAYTSGGADAGWFRGETGRLRPGARADFVVLDRDLFAGAPHEMMSETGVVRTFVGGVERFAAEE
jgi:predicted amidohydrolase YtcJ